MENKIWGDLNHPLLKISEWRMFKNVWKFEPMSKLNEKIPHSNCYDSDLESNFQTLNFAYF